MSAGRERSCRVSRPKSYRNVKQFERRKRWLSLPSGSRGAGNRGGIMSLPGFSALSSLEPAMGTYRGASTVGTAAGSQVVAALPISIFGYSLCCCGWKCLPGLPICWPNCTVCHADPGGACACTCSGGNPQCNCVDAISGAGVLVP